MRGALPASGAWGLADQSASSNRRDVIRARAEPPPLSGRICNRTSRTLRRSRIQRSRSKVAPPLAEVELLPDDDLERARTAGDGQLDFLRSRLVRHFDLEEDRADRSRGIEGHREALRAGARGDPLGRARSAPSVERVLDRMLRVFGRDRDPRARFDVDVTRAVAGDLGEGSACLLSDRLSHPLFMARSEAACVDCATTVEPTVEPTVEAEAHRSKRTLGYARPRMRFATLLSGPTIALIRSLASSWRRDAPTGFGRRPSIRRR